MAVDLEKMAATTEHFQQQQLVAFEQFIDNSKALKDSVKGEQQQAQKQFEIMDKQVTSLNEYQPTASNIPLILAMQYSKPYLASLNNVTMIPAENHNTVFFIHYMNKRIKQYQQQMQVEPNTISHKESIK